jgi:hypothetical protein
MKKLLTILLIAPLFAFAQSLQLSDIGLPQDCEVVKDVVITSSKINTITIRSGRVATNTTRPTITGYALNFIHSKIHEDGFVYQGKMPDGGLLFTKAPITFTRNGQTFNIDGSSMQVYRDLQGLWTILMIPQTSSYRLLVNRRWITYTADQLAASAGITKEQLWSMDADFYYASERNPATTLTSAFVQVNRINESTFNATLYINLQPVNGASNLLNNNDVIWRFYNDCDGQHGQCEQRAVGAGNQSLPQSFTFDYSKEYITIECAIGDPKRVDFRGYYLVQGCDEDDPCGPAQRLPRKPAQ